MCMTADEILVDGLIKKVVKEQNQLEVAIGEGMEFTIHGDVKAKTKKSKHLMNNSKVNMFLQFMSSNMILNLYSLIFLMFPLYSTLTIELTLDSHF